MFWTQTRPDNRTLAAVVGGLVALAWLSIATWSFSPYDRYLHHGSLDDLTVGVPAMMVIEKNVLWGEQISRPLGASLLLAATLAAVDGVLAVP